MSDNSLTINNAKICDFYKNNPQLNFETMSILFHEIIEKILDNSSSAINSTINNQILSSVNDNQHKMRDLINSISNIESRMTQMNTDITNSMIVKMIDIKKEYIDEMKSVISIENTEKTDKLGSLIERNNDFLVEKTNNLLRETSLSTETSHSKQLEETLKQFQEDIINETKSVNSTDSFNNFISAFDGKYNTFNNTICNLVSSSEARLKNDIDAIKDATITSNAKNDSIFNELGDYLRRFQNSSNKGAASEMALESVLTTLFPSGEIKNTANIKASGDFFIRRLNNPSVMVENKVYERNVNMDEVKKFIRDVEETKCHGIFLSQSSGITSKGNYTIDLHKGNVLVYVHHVNYSKDKIQVAFDIIDNLDQKLKLISQNKQENTITQDELDNINQEFQSFLNQKDTLIQCAKDIQKKLVYQIEHMNFPSLDKYLGSKDYSSARRTEYICDICGVYSAPSKKALSAHQRGCRKVHPIENSVIQVNTTNTI